MNRADRTEVAPDRRAGDLATHADIHVSDRWIQTNLPDPEANAESGQDQNRLNFPNPPLFRSGGPTARPPCDHAASRPREVAPAPPIG